MATNWVPAAIPNGPTDTATFDVSSGTSVAITAATQVDGVVFTSSASPFSIVAKHTSATTNIFTLSGAGVTNNSGITQNFATDTFQDRWSEIHFSNTATAGSNVVYSATGSDGFLPGFIEFFDMATAGSATIVHLGPDGINAQFGRTEFNDSSTAGESTIMNNSNGLQGGFINFRGNSTAGQASIFNNGGMILFFDSSTAGDAVFTEDGNFPGIRINFVGTSNAGNATFLTTVNDTSTTTGSIVAFYGDSSAGNATFTMAGSSLAGISGNGVAFDLSTGETADHANFILNGGTVSGALGGYVTFSGASGAGAVGPTAANSISTAHPGEVSGALGGVVNFVGIASGNANPTAGDATLIANAGLNGAGGGGILLQGNALGGNARVEVFGNGYLDISNHSGAVTTGSLEGDGLVFLGGNALKVGTNNLETVFSGTMQESGGIKDGNNGSFTKLGTAKLTLSGASTFTGGTTLSSGTLAVSNRTGSATGTGAVQVTAGTLGGSGIISGAVALGTGGDNPFLAPALGTPRQATLTIQSTLTCNSGSTYTYSFKANGRKSKSDKVIANGVTIKAGASITLQGTIQGTLQIGLVLTAISNTSGAPIGGAFSNLADGAIVAISGNNFQASYEGGDGNDLTLTVVP